ncbi:MAG: hypothetical protein KGS72_23950 [Cyanobacteria bacterium REEB67]|nr:hypothetical protein [Cyanobacteria bacterium REEB67]
MDNNFVNTIKAADVDATNLKDGGDLNVAAQGLQKLFDDTTEMTYSKRAFLLNSYTKEINSKADDIYGKGNHITLEIVDTNQNDHIDAGDKIHVAPVHGMSRDVHISNIES